MSSLSTVPALLCHQTEGVLGSLPEDMRHTLTRPGIMHTLPRPFQDLLLPPNATSRAGSRQGTDSDRGRRRLRGRTEGFQEGTRGPGTRAIEDGGDYCAEVVSVVVPPCKIWSDAAQRCGVWGDGGYARRIRGIVK